MEKETNTNESEQKVEEANKNISPETAETNLNNGKPEIDVLKEADRVNTEMKKENDRKQKLLDREEKILTRQETLRALGGGSPAGNQPAKPAEETPKEYAEAVMNGKVKNK